MRETETALDAALARMAEAPDDAQARLAMHAELSRCEVFVLLEAEVIGDRMVPRVFDLSDSRAVLAFDSEMRLAGFAGEAAAYAALPGRVLVNLLAQSPEPLALMLNPDADHAGFLLHDALLWLDTTLAAPAPTLAQGTPDTLFAPDLPPAVLDRLVPALERRLAGTPGLKGAVLAGVRWTEGGQGHLLALSGLPEAAQPPAARAVSEALALSGLDAAALDVVFPDDAAMDRIAVAGLALTPLAAVVPDEQIIALGGDGVAQSTNENGRAPGANPGMDPDRPPKLR